MKEDFNFGHRRLSNKASMSSTGHRPPQRRARFTTWYGDGRDGQGREANGGGESLMREVLGGFKSPRKCIEKPAISLKTDPI